MKRLVWSNELWDKEEAMKEWGLDEEDYEFLNSDYSYDDAFCEMNISVPEKIVVIADLGLWDGRRCGVKELGNNVAQCLQTECDYATWYIDSSDLRCDAVHHDGTNHYLYRVWKENISEATKRNFIMKVIDGKAKRADISRCTVSVKRYIEEREKMVA